MTLDEYIADIEAKRNALQLRLALTLTSDLSLDVKTERFNQIAEEARALRLEVEEAVSKVQKRPI
jgi:hypothetical protein